MSAYSAPISGVAAISNGTVWGFHSARSIFEEYGKVKLVAALIDRGLWFEGAGSGD